MLSLLRTNSFLISKYIKGFKKYRFDFRHSNKYHYIDCKNIASKHVINLVLIWILELRFLLKITATLWQILILFEVYCFSQLTYITHGNIKCPLRNKIFVFNFKPRRDLILNIVCLLLCKIVKRTIHKGERKVC